MIIGLSFSHLDWGDQIIDNLSENNQLILFDNRDSGRSQRDLEPYTILKSNNIQFLTCFLP